MQPVVDCCNVVFKASGIASQRRFGVKVFQDESNTYFVSEIIMLYPQAGPGAKLAYIHIKNVLPPPVPHSSIKSPSGQERNTPQLGS